MKKMLSIILSMICVLSLGVSSNVFAYENTDIIEIAGGSYSEDDLLYENFYYHLLDDGTAEITKYIGTEKEVSIPKAFDNIIVTRIGAQAFFQNSELTEITIPDCVTMIGGTAFGECTSLCHVVIPDSVTIIDWTAFYHCTALESVILGNSLTTISPYAFSGCTSLKSFVIPDSVTTFAGNALDDCSSLESVVIGNSVTGFRFKGCTNLKEVTIGNSVSSIGRNSFADCKNLERINISDLAAWCNIDFEFSDANPLSITPNLYLNGELLTDIVIPETVSVVKKHAFYNNTYLKSVTFPDSFITVEHGAFGECTELESITFGNSPSTIDINAFYGCNDIREIHIKDIAAWCDPDFQYYPDYPYNENIQLYYFDEPLTDLVIPDTVTQIRDRAFENCTSLKRVTIGNSVRRVGWYAFAGCYSIDEVSIESIDDWVEIDFANAFANPLWSATDNAKLNYDESVTTVVIPDRKTNIVPRAFFNCDAIKEIVIPNSVTVIGSGAFSGCTGLETINIPSLVTDISEIDFLEFSNLKNIFVDENNTEFCDIDGILFNKEKNLLICYPQSKDETVAVLPEGTEELANFSFYNCDQVTGIVIPQSLIHLNGSAFIQCDNLRDFTFTKDIKSIADIGYVWSGEPGVGRWIIGKVDNVTIRGYSGTVAETYAKDNGFLFISLGKVDRLLGDADGDDDVTILDVTVIQRRLADMTVGSFIEEPADVDRDDEVSIIDATYIQRFLAVLQTCEGIGKVFVY